MDWSTVGRDKKALFFSETGFFILLLIFTHSQIYSIWGHKCMGGTWEKEHRVRLGEVGGVVLYKKSLAAAGNA